MTEHEGELQRENINHGSDGGDTEGGVAEELHRFASKLRDRRGPIMMAFGISGLVAVAFVFAATHTAIYGDAFLVGLFQGMIVALLGVNAYLFGRRLGER